MTMRLLPALLLAASLLPATMSAAPNLVILVRHAEKEALPADDPDLTSAGKERAQELARIVTTLTVTGARVRGLFSSQFKRTQQTLEPLATATGLPIVKASDVALLTKKILALKGGIAVVAGHTNTVPELLKGLAGPAGVTIDESEYRRLFVIRAPGSNRATLVVLRYGAGD